MSTSMIMQAYDLNDCVIQDAKWDLKEIPKVFNVGHTLILSLPFNDKNLAAYMAKLNNNTCYVDVDEDTNETSAMISFKITDIKHMYTMANGIEESLCAITPSSKLAVQILTYLVSPDKANKKLLDIIS